MMRGVTGQKPLGFGNQVAGGSTKNLFGRGSNSSLAKSAEAPLGRSIRGGTQRPKSALSREYPADEDDEEPLRSKPGTFQMPSGDEDEDEPTDGDIDAEMEKYLEEDMAEDAEGEDDDDVFLNMGHEPAYGERYGTEESDLMVLTTPAADERIRKEAEGIFRATARRRSTRQREFKFASIAKGLYSQMGFALISESPEVILKTEELVGRLYDEGVGPEDDAEKLDNSLANIAYGLVKLWDRHASELPQPEGEHAAEIGPGPETEPFGLATYVAHLVLRIHHTRFQEQTDGGKVPPLTEILFDWMQTNHNQFPDQLRDVKRHKPSPACHSLFWQTLGSALIRGNVSGAAELLGNAGWEYVRKGPRGEHAYSGKALDNVERAANATCEMLENCPGSNGNWDIWSSDWTLFRIQARASLEKLMKFAEGKDRLQVESDEEDSRGRQSLAGLARKAESQVPWEVYEHLQIIYDVVLGGQESILDTAQDWCEATIGLFGWWEEGRERHNKSIRLSRSQSLRLSTPFGGPQSYSDRLAHAFHTVVEGEFHFNAMNPVEVAIACAFEGNFAGVIGILRAWSLPIASAVAELASLGQWLPKPERSTNNLLMESLDMDDLELLGMVKQGPDELDGIKDTTLIQYARELAGIDQVSGQQDGWEMAIHVLGRMDSAKRSEEMVGELLKDLINSLDLDSGETVDRIWRILNDLGMISYAEDTAEVGHSLSLLLSLY
jgi:hypothetical protein